MFLVLGCSCFLFSKFKPRGFININAVSFVKREGRKRNLSKETKEIQGKKTSHNKEQKKAKKSGKKAKQTIEELKNKIIPK